MIYRPYIPGSGELILNCPRCNYGTVSPGMTCPSCGNKIPKADSTLHEPAPKLAPRTPKGTGVAQRIAFIAAIVMISVIIFIGIVSAVFVIVFLNTGTGYETVQEEPEPDLRIIYISGSGDGGAGFYYVGSMEITVKNDGVVTAFADRISIYVRNDDEDIKWNGEDIAPGNKATRSFHISYFGDMQSFPISIKYDNLTHDSYYVMAI